VELPLVVTEIRGLDVLYACRITRPPNKLMWSGEKHQKKEKGSDTKV
jgi:hypothetical protein